MKVKCPNCGYEFELNKKRKKFSERARDPISKLRKILIFLKKYDDFVWIRRIAKATKLKPFAVSYLIDKYLSPYLEIIEPKDVYENLGIKMKMVKLKNKEMDFNSILHDISLRKERR